MRWTSLCIALGFLAVSCAKRVPLPLAWVGKSSQDVRGVYHGHKPLLQGYTCDVDLTFHKGWFKAHAEAVLAVQRPSNVRLDVIGPHGALLWAVAVDGRKVRRLDFMQQTAYENGVSPAAMDQVLGLGEFGLTPEEWLDVLQGWVDIPADASMVYDDRKGCFAYLWEKGEGAYKACVGVADLRLLFFERLHKKKPAVRMEYAQWDTHGLPSKMKAVVLQPKSMRSDVLLSLHDRDVNPSLDEGLFQWDIPEGFTFTNQDTARGGL
jgi:hypothetical protein